MIEIVCDDRLQKEEICLPKNIRQVGSPRGRHKIYIEDYVYTYLKAAAQKKESCAVVFLGQSQVMKDIRYTFISGAAECGPGAFQVDRISLDDNFWQYIFLQHIEEERKTYFPEKEIVGWFLGRAGQAMELTSAVEALHRKYFPGRDKVLMLMDISEGEEVFFIYDQGYLQKREGYYIYYEKNLPMQEYMIQKKGEVPREVQQQLEETVQKENSVRIEKNEQGESTAQIENNAQKDGQIEEAAQAEKDGQPGQGNAHQPEPVTGTETEADKFRELHKELEREIGTGSQEKIFAKSNSEEPKTQAEEALESYRHMMLERQGRQIERQNRKFLYTASSFFLVAVCVLGITTINNYRKMQKVEDVLQVMSNQASEGKREEEEGGPVVESVTSQVTPLEENGETPVPEEDSQGADKPQTGTESQPTEGSGADGQGTGQAGTAAEGQASGMDSQGTGQAGTAAEGQASGMDSQGTGQAGAAAEGQASGTSEAAGQGTDAESQPPETAGESGDSEESAETSVSQPETRYYTVQPGDTLGSICIRIYHDRNMMAKVCEANGIDNGDKIYVGQKLILP